MQKNDTHIQNLINKAKQEEPVVPKEFARTLLEKQALQTSAMSHINKGTKMLNTISIASMAASVALLMNTITTSNINKNEVSKIKEQNPKEQIIVQKNDVAQANIVKSDKKSGESVEINAVESTDDVQVRIYKVKTANNTAPIKQIFPTKQVMPTKQLFPTKQIMPSTQTLADNQIRPAKLIVADKQNIPTKQIPSAENTLLAGNKPETKQINQNKTTTDNPIDIVGINPIKLTKEEIEKLGFVVEKGGHFSYYNSDGIDKKHFVKYSILYPWGFEYSDQSDTTLLAQSLINPKFRLISNQNGEKRVSIFTENLGDNTDDEAFGKLSRTVQYNKQNNEEQSIYKFNFDKIINAKINATCYQDSNSNAGSSSNVLINFQQEDPNNQGFEIVFDTTNQLASTILQKKVYIRTCSDTNIDTSNIELLFEKFELNNELINIDSTSNTDFKIKQFEFNDDINLNELLPIEVEMIDNNGEPLYADGKLQTLIIWFEPTMEFIEKLPEQIKRKLSPELEAMPSDYETCPTPPVTGGQPHFDVWRACSGAVENLKTYPTPVEDVLHFKYTLAEDRQISMYVCNLNGEVIANPIKYETYRKGCVEDQINVGYLNSGMYLLVISSDTGEKAVQRFLVK